MLVLGLFSNHFNVFAQYRIDWQKQVDGLGMEDPGLFIRTSDGGYVAISNPDGDQFGDDNFVITKFSQSGFIEWQNPFPGADDNDITSIIQTKDGGYMIGGIMDTGDNDDDETYSDNKVAKALHARHEQDDFWIIKMDSRGVIQWQKNYGGEDDDELKGVVQTSEGGYLIYGITDSKKGDVKGNHGESDIWLVKINNSGTIEWKKCYGGTDDDEPGFVKQTSDGGFVIAGITNSDDKDVRGYHGRQDVWVYKIDNSGKMIWQRIVGSSAYDELSGFTQTSDGGFIVSGFSRGVIKEIDSKKDVFINWICKINYSGVIVWNSTIDSNRNSTIFSVLPTLDGGCAVARYVKKEFMDNLKKSVDSTYYNYFVLYYNNMGVLIGKNDLGMFKDYEVNFIEPSNDFGYILSGDLNEKYNKKNEKVSREDLWLVKLKSQ